ncbi:MAG: GPR endopeptidase [bacterium]|nr:GPR endopeptidase [bacterium]
MDIDGFSVRTDLADEAQRLWLGTAGDKSIPEGVKAETKDYYGFELCCVDITSRAGEAALKKPMGKYYCLSLPKHFSRGCGDFHRMVQALAELIRNLSHGKTENVFIAALGNPKISPDALGHCTADHILVSRHLEGNVFSGLSSVSLCRPGVLGCSGMESALQVKKLCELVEPDLIIAVDALAGSEPERLCRCIQLSDTGISPGSGVGNDRQELSRASLSVPVISIGMPTVIDAGHFGHGAMSKMFVTPRDIDLRVKEAGRLIAYAINIAIHQGLSIEDVDGLIN